MISHTTDQFWRSFALLPERIQQQAEKAYDQWKADPYYQGLHFKCIHKPKSVYSVRIGIGYRAIGVHLVKKTGNPRTAPAAIGTPQPLHDDAVHAVYAEGDAGGAR